MPTLCKRVFSQCDTAVVINAENRAAIFALNEWLNTGKVADTYRPCYATLVPKKIRRRYRVFLHLCIEGKVMSKFDKYGKPRYKFGKGVVGADIGTQTVAYTSETQVGLKND